MHISDWLPTLYAAAGGRLNELENLDGISQWSHLVNEKIEAPRTQFLVNIDEKLDCWAMVKDEWKLIKGSQISRAGKANYYFGETGRDGKEYQLDLVVNSLASRALRPGSDLQTRELYLKRRESFESYHSLGCEERISAGNLSHAYGGMIPSEKNSCIKAPCLYNIHQDPCEFHNVAQDYPSIVAELHELLTGYKSQLVKQQDHGFDPIAHPDQWGGYWAPWMDGETFRLS